MENKRYPLPPVYAYLTFWLSVAAGVGTFLWVNGPWYVSFPAGLAVYMGTEPPLEHHRRPLLAKARKRDATHEERPGLSLPLVLVWSRVWSCLGRCHFVVERLIGGGAGLRPHDQADHHQRRKYSLSRSTARRAGISD